MVRIDDSVKSWLMAVGRDVNAVLGELGTGAVGSSLLPGQFEIVTEW